MPIPIIAAALASSLGGVVAHRKAKGKNEKAHTISEEAQKMYNESKELLEAAQKRTEKSLLALGYLKKDVLDTSVSQFLTAYERVKDIELRESRGLDEMSKLTLDSQAVIELREMTDIYKSAFSSGATGVAAGAVVALATTGTLPALSAAGTFLMAGEIGAAAGIAGSALSTAAAATPLAAIAAPVILFTGISSNIKAGENLEKANAMYAEAKKAAEKMKISEVLCDAITQKADLYEKLLSELNTMFSKCTALLDGVTAKKQGVLKNKKLTQEDLTEEELNLIAVTRALAGAVKTVIDTPILGEDGEITEKSEKVYNDSIKLIPEFSEQVKCIEETKFIAKPVPVAREKE